MNWLYSLMFYLFVFCQYLLLGDSVISLTKFRRSAGMVVITGFLTTFFIMFLVGFPCQILFTSFELYFILQLVTFITIDGILLWINRKRIKSWIKAKSFKDFSVLSFLKQNWVCIVFVVLFTYISMSNQLPVYQMNYDDMYYIGKINNLSNAAHLLDTDYFNGKVLDELKISFDRHVNTYELSYAFFSVLFRIKATFFCRATMTLHNYALFTVVYKELAKRFVREEHSQYAILPFYLFIIPFGYLQAGLPFQLKVHSYDLWQFQTASFYGGSIVRNLGLPLLYIFSEPLLRKIEMKKLIFVVVFSITMISFSTIFAQQVILFLYVILVLKFLLIFKKSIKDKKIPAAITSAFVLLVMSAALVLTKFLDYTPLLSESTYSNFYLSYMSFYGNWYSRDIIFLIGMPIVLIGLLMQIRSDKKYLYLICLGLFCLTYGGIFGELLTVSAFGYLFVALRMLSSIQYLIIMLCGCTVIMIAENLRIKVVHCNTIAATMIIALLSVFVIGLEEFKTHEYLGSGVSADGWDFSRPLNINTDMTAEIFTEVGDYFNHLPGEKYKLFCPISFMTDGIKTYDYGFVMSSHKIQIQDRDGFEELSEDELSYLSDYCMSGTGAFEKITDYIEKEGIQYVLVFNENVKNEFDKHYTPVLENTDNINPYYLYSIQ